MTMPGCFAVAATTLLLCHLCAAEAAETCADDLSNLMQLRKQQQLESNMHARELRRRESPGVLLNAVAFLETHDAGTGLGVTGLTPNSFAQTQQGDLVSQLNCGARALDLRLAAENGKVLFHHSDKQGTMDFQSSMRGVVAWANAHPTEFVVLYFNHCQDWDGTHTNTDCAGTDFFINKVRDLGINIVPNLMGPGCYNETGTQMTYARAKELAKLPGGGMLLPLFQNTAGGGPFQSNCVNEEFTKAAQANTWGTGAGFSSEDKSCPYLGTDKPFFYKWAGLWTYAQGILGVNGQGKMHETQLLWQEDGASVTSSIITGGGLIQLNQRSYINEAVYKQIVTGFLPAAQLNMVKMNDICRWGPEISRLFGAIVSESDAAQCDKHCPQQIPENDNFCDSSDVCCGAFDHDCCGECRCVSGNYKCTISGESDGSHGPCDGVCNTYGCSNVSAGGTEAHTGRTYSTWAHDGYLTFCPEGYKC